MKLLLRKELSILPLVILFSCGGDNEIKGTEDLSSEIKLSLEKILPEEISLISVEKTDLEGYYEVNFDGIEPLYVAQNGKYLISGDIYEISSQGLINKSDARKRYQRAKSLANLDEEEFITFKPTNPKFTIYVFTDVDCGYCRQFHRQINDYVNLGIKINYLAFPRAGIGSESYKKIVSAWCSEDRNFALTELKLGREIKYQSCKENPVEKHFNLGESLGVRGTPSIITLEGRLIPGYLPPKDLLKELDI